MEIYRNLGPGVYKLEKGARSLVWETCINVLKDRNLGDPVPFGMSDLDRYETKREDPFGYNFR